MRKYKKSKLDGVIFAVFILIGVFLIVGRFTSCVMFVKNFVYYILYPNVSAANFILHSAEGVVGNIKSVVYARQENIVYKQKNQELVDKLRNYSSMCKNYSDLVKLLKLSKTKNTRSVFAKISVREPSEWYQYFILDKGKRDGLRNELPVLMFNKKKNTLCAVGRIIETHETSSKVVLITNSIYALPVEIKGKGINCLAEGFNSSLLKVTYIPKKADIKDGDEIVVSGLSEFFHKDVPVGFVTEVSEDQLSDFKTATAKVFFDENIVHKAIILVPISEVKVK
jgi:rod shape-determining protein MreC